MLLTDDEIKAIDWMQGGLHFARAIESAVLKKLKAQEPVAWRYRFGNVWMFDTYRLNGCDADEAVPVFTNPLPPADVVRDDPRIAELEAVLRECREALVHCEGVFDEVRGYPITYDLTIEAIAKIDEVLKCQ